MSVSGARAGAAVSAAASFYNSVGVDTHVTFANTAYRDWPRLVGLLDQLGVKHLSDSAYGNPAWGWFNNYYRNAVELAVSHGIHFAFQMGKPGYDGGSIDQLVSVMSGPLRNSVEALEDPNEFDSSGSPGWASQLSAYDSQLYAAVKANPSLSSLPVIGPSLVGDNAPAQLGNQQSSLDIGGIHPYTGGLAPSVSYTNAQLQRISAVSGQKPVWATELGYYNALNAPAGTLQPVSEAAGAVYLLREYLEEFRSGIARTYAYELIDDSPDAGNSDIQQHFGLLRNDYSPKPSYTALKNLLSLVGQQAPATLTPLTINYSAAPSDMRQMILQQDDNTYLVVQWRLASVWNTDLRQDLSVASAPVTFNVPNATSAAIADPITTSTLTPLTLSNGQINTSLSADPTVIQIKTTPATTHAQRASASALASRTLPAVATKQSRVVNTRAPAPKCHTSTLRFSSVTPSVQPTLRWLTSLLNVLTCAHRAAGAKLQLYTVRSVSSHRGGSHRKLAETIVGGRRVDSHDPQATANWIVVHAKSEARHGRRLLVRFLLLHG